MAIKPQLPPSRNTGCYPSKDFSKVLILGGDNYAFRLVERLCEEGFVVIYCGKLARDTMLGKNIENVQVIANGVLKSITGVIGAFHAFIESPHGPIEIEAGFLVVVQPPVILPKFEDYGVKPGDHVVALSSFLEDLRSGKNRLSEKSGPRHVAFFVGMDGAADTVAFAKVFDCIDILLTHGSAQCHVFTRHVKVAEDGLEARYRSIREQGTLFFAFEDHSPVVEQTFDGAKIVFSEPHLSSEFELNCDLLVIDEKLMPPESVPHISEMIPSSFHSKPYLTPASPRYPGVSTAKVGVFAVGAARGEFYPSKIEDDIESVVGSIKKIIRIIESGGSGFVASVEPSTCTLCLTCVRICPHGAIDFGLSARVDRDACLGCGICASECPMRSIGLTSRKIQSDNNSVVLPCGIQLAANPESKIVAFLCEHSAANAYAELSAAFKALVNPIIVPCAGAVGEVDIIQALLEGAKGVIVAGCFPGNCASVYGTNRAGHRVQRVREILVETGLTPHSLIFVQSASNMPLSLASAIEELSRASEWRTTKEAHQRACHESQ